jgi:polynucleotide 5'-hydroxyl-kinase GRC3/NOL9
LPSQVSNYVTKTAAHLRTMQTMSYFHIKLADGEKLAWSTQPLSSMPPWEIRYSGENAGILGIMCYGEQPPPSLLLESINGSLLAVVVLDDMAAIPGWEREERDNIEKDTYNDQPYPMDMGDTELRVLDDGSLHPQHLEIPLIVRTPNEDLPYFNPANAISLDPKHSHCIGLALVRGIDISRRRLQIITPISPDVIGGLNETGKSIVLVSGKFDTPGWAYTEALMQKQSLEKTALKLREDDMDVEEGNESDEDSTEQERRSLGEGFQNAPWVERQEGSQGRAVGSRVWRVRRDLGRSGD